MKNQKQHWQKKKYQKVTLETKLFVVVQIQNGQISTNFASKKYDVPRTTIGYWIKKYSTLVQQNNGMSKNEEIKKLKEKKKNWSLYKTFSKILLRI
ncbi:MAG: helix-turn-helix domain-containing protein [Polaribacter sp.]